MMKIYIDGACAVHTGKNGAWAYVVVVDDKVIHEDSGFEYDCTNQRMELKAAVIATRWCVMKKVSSAEIISDSAYLINGITKWVKTWLNNGWKTSAGEDVKNKELWWDLIYSKDFVDLKWTWVKGHSGEKWNEYVDSLCKIVAEQTPLMELKSAEKCYTTK